MLKLTFPGPNCAKPFWNEMKRYVRKVSCYSVTALVINNRQIEEYQDSSTVSFRCSYLHKSYTGNYFKKRNLVV